LLCMYVCKYVNVCLPPENTITINGNGKVKDGADNTQFLLLLAAHVF